MKKRNRAVALLLSAVLTVSGAMTYPVTALAMEEEAAEEAVVESTEVAAGDSSFAEAASEEDSATDETAEEISFAEKEEVAEATDEASYEISFDEEAADAAYSEEQVIEEEVSDTELMELADNQLTETIFFEYDKETGALSITGKGAIPEYDRNNNPMKECTMVTSITIGEGITEIGKMGLNGVMYGRDGVVKITLPSTLKTLRYGSLMLGHGNVDVTIPKSVTTIDPFAFMGHFKKLAFEEGIKTIPSEVFRGCDVYNGEIVFPDSLETIADRGLQQLSYYGPMTFPRNLKYIGENAFTDYRGNELYFTGNLPKFGKDAFVKNINTPFDAYKIDDLFVAYYPADNATWTDKAIEELSKSHPQVCFRKNGEAIYSGKCGENIEWTYSASDKTLKLTGSGAMTDYTANRLPDWIDYRKEIKTIIIDDAITSIGDYAFFSCKPEKDAGSCKLQISDKNKLERIGKCAFLGTYFMNKNLFPKVTYIGDYAFYDYTCYSYPDKCVLNSELTYLGDHAFENCKYLYLVIPKFTKLTRIGDSVFRDCSRATGSLEFSDEITYIGVLAFAGCSMIDSEIKLPKNLTFMGQEAFQYADLAKGDIVIPDGLTEVAMDAFDRTAITSVTMGKGVKSIRSSAFKDCKSLKEVKLNAGIENIATSAFWNCTSLTEIVIPSSVTMMYFDAFMGSGISKITFLGDIPMGRFFSGSINMNPEIHYPGSNKTWTKKTDDEKAEYLMITRFKPVFVADGEVSEEEEPEPVDPSPVDPTPVDPKPVDPEPVDPTPEENDAIVISSSYTYTGKPITCSDMKVYDGETLLKAGTDYTVKFKNNTKAGTATVTVTFKGKYSGTLTKDFEITPFDLEKAWNDGDVSFGNYQQYYKYNGKVQKPKASLLLQMGDKPVVLKEGTDFYFTYPESDDEELVYGPNVLKLPGTYTIFITGMGNYKGDLFMQETITELNLMKDVKVHGVKDRPYDEYDGETVQGFVYATYKGKKLLPNRDFEISYCNNDQVGTATMFLTALEDSGFVGTKQVNFKILGTPVSRQVITEFKSSVPYDKGRVIYQDEMQLYTSAKAAKEGDPDGVLNLFSDYDVEYVNNVDTGKATMTIKGLGKYTGTVKKTFKITPLDITNDTEIVTRKDGESDESILEKSTVGIVVIREKSYEYAKAGAKPQPVVYAAKYDGGNNIYYELLTLAKDYTLSYGKNNAVGEGAGSLKISFKRNYKGTAGFTFDIDKADMRMYRMFATDVKQKNAPGICKPKVTVYDPQGKLLTVGKDYDYDIIYRNDTTLLKYDKATKKYVEDRVVRGGTKVDMKHDIIPAGTKMEACFYPRGNYWYKTESGKPVYANVRFFTVYGAGKDISKAKITIVDKVLTGNVVNLNYGTDFSVATLEGKELVPGTDFTVQEYKNNNKPGKCTVVLRGCGSYAGTKTVTFKIVPRKMGK